MRKCLILALILIGFTSTIAQILLMRELTGVFYGNELSLGVTLASWLFWTGMGSALLGRLTDRLKKPIQLFVILQILFPLIIACEIFLVRNIRNILGVEHGVLIGIIPMLLSCFLVLLPLCVVSGFLFTVGCKVYTEAKKDVAPQIGQVYIYDGLGDILGGIVFTYLLVYFFHSLETISYIFILNLVASFSILYHLPKQIILKGINIILLVLISLSIFFHQSDVLQQFSKRLQWKGYNLVVSKDSIYGNIAITREENQYSFYESGLPVFAVPDKVSSEQLIHFPMVMHPAPKHILIIGKGVGGGLTETLKHPETKVHYVELDPMIIDLAKKYLPKEDLKSLEKCQVHLMDGRLFVKRTKTKFDLIMVNLPDPATAQLNRFYTKEFFKEIKNILNTDGVFSIGVTSDENYLSEELKNFNGCIYKTLKEVFEEVIIAPGQHLLFFASPKEGVLTYDTQVLAQRFTARKIQTTYVDEYYFPYRLLQDRIVFVKEEIEDYNYHANTDFYPICYFYNIVLWSTQFYTSIRLFFNWFAKINLYWIFGLLVGLVFLHVLICKKRAQFTNTSIPIAIMTTGYAGLSLEIILIFGFQVLYGYIYHRIGMIVASFMIGLVIGTLLMNQLLNKINDEQGIRTLAKIEFSIVIYSFLLPIIFLILSNLKTQASIFIAVELLFPILTIITGIFVGAEFPLANKLYLKDFHKVGKTAGLIYGFDLFGACLGGLLSTILFIPILGIFQTCFICGLFNLASFILVLRLRYWYK
ncbi:MAG: methyltransferase [bacterium]